MYIAKLIINHGNCVDNESDLVAKWKGRYSFNPSIFSKSGLYITFRMLAFLILCFVLGKPPVIKGFSQLMEPLI